MEVWHILIFLVLIAFQKNFKKSIETKNITTNSYRIQAYDPIMCEYFCFGFIDFMLNNNPLNANPEKWSNTLKQIVGNLPTICLSVFDHFMNLVLQGIKDLLILLI